jgi:hypothetical protein
MMLSSGGMRERKAHTATSAAGHAPDKPILGAAGRLRATFSILGSGSVSACWICSSNRATIDSQEFSLAIFKPRVMAR